MRIHRPTLLTAIWVALFSLCIGAAILAVAWEHTNNRISSNQHRSDQRWCTLLDQINFPRTTAAGKQFSAALTELEREFGCIK